MGDAMKATKSPQTIRDLRDSDYQVRPIREELRRQGLNEGEDFLCVA